jgi:hypothetical protein
VKREWQESLLLLLCAGILAWQLFLPGFIGMANNGDFGKISGFLSIGGADNSADNFIFFEPHYQRSPNHYFAPEVPTSEAVLAWLASTAERIVGSASTFDIRWLGALHALIFLGVYYTVLVILRPLVTAWRLALSLAALWIFADVGTLAYFNSFYMDTAAILGALAATMLVVRLGTGDLKPSIVIWFVMAAGLFVTAKGQHAIAALLPVAVAAAILLSHGKWRLAGSLGAVILAGSIWTLARMPDWYGGQSRFDLIFFHIAPRSPSPARDLRELGLSDSDLRYAGMHAFMQGTPMADPSFARQFSKRSSYARILVYYLRHPGIPAGKLWADLCQMAPQRRPQNLSNFQRAEGMPPGAQTRRLGSWSAFRSELLRRWPWHMVIWYAFALAGFPLLAMRRGRGSQEPLAWVICAIAAAGLGEFLVASLADAVETDRHLLLFHLFTDATMFLALVWAAPLADMRAARSDVQRVQRLAGRHKQPVALHAAETNVGADLRKQDQADAFSFRGKDVDTVVTGAGPAYAGPDVAIHVCADSISRSGWLAVAVVIGELAFAAQAPPVSHLENLNVPGRAGVADI